MQQQPVLTIKMIPAGVEYVLALLNKQPREQSDPLFLEIFQQYREQMAAHQAAAAAAEAPADAAVGGTD